MFGRKPKEKKAPPKMEFRKGRLSGHAILDEANLTEGSRSFMDRGKDVFEGEKDRESVILSVRNNILSRMEEENKASEADAEAMKNRHRQHTALNMDLAIEEAKKTRREADLAKAEWLLAKSRLGEDREEVSREMTRLLEKEEHNRVAGQESMFLKTRRTVALTESGVGTMGEDIDDIDQEGGARSITAEAERPEDQQARAGEYSAFSRIKNEFEKYSGPGKEAKGLKRFWASREKNAAEQKMNEAQARADTAEKNILDTAEAWNQLLQEYRDTTFRRHYEAYDALARDYYVYTRTAEDRTLGGDAAKNIAEYTGVYDEERLRDVSDLIRTDAYARAPLSYSPRKELSEGSLNAESTDRLTKFHRTVAMNAFGEGVQGLRQEQRTGRKQVRMKILNDFTRYKAKSQFTDRTYTALEDAKESEAVRGKSRDALQNPEAPAYKLTLTADEKGANDEFLRSEETEEIQTVHVPVPGDQKEKTEEMGFYSGGRFYAGNRWAREENREDQASELGEMAKRERIREAIRRSDFFRHVNSGTIQYYMGYDPDDDMGVGASEEDLYYADSSSPARAAMNLIEAYLSPGTIMASLYHADRDQKTLDRIRELAFASTERDTEEHMKHLGVLLLSKEDPELWGIARELAGKAGGKLKDTLKGLPDNGQIMRIALMEEFAKDRSFSLLRLGKSLTPHLNKRGEKTMAERGHKRSLLFLRQGVYSFLGYGPSKEFPMGDLPGAVPGAKAPPSNQAAQAPLAERQEELRNLRQARAEFMEAYTEYLDASGGESGDGATGEDAAEKDSKEDPSWITRQMDQVEELLEKTEDARAWASFGMSVSAAASELIMGAAIIRRQAAILKQTSDPDIRMRAKLSISGVAEKTGSSLANLGVTIAKVAGVAEQTLSYASGGIGLAGNLWKIGNLSARMDMLRKEGSSGKISEERMENEMEKLEKKRQETDYEISYSSEAGLTPEEKMALAYEQNTQGVQFTEMANRRNRQEKIQVGSELAENVGGAVLGAVGLGLPAVLLAKPLAKAASFVGKFIGVLVGIHDYGNFMKEILGESEYTNFKITTAFDQVLKRETGIKNSYYLQDLGRVFAAIDTHTLLNSPDKSEGEKQEITNMMRPFLKTVAEGKQVPDEELKKVRLNKLLLAVGAPGNWRAVLRSAIS